MMMSYRVQGRTDLSLRFLVHLHLRVKTSLYPRKRWPDRPKSGTKEHIPSGTVTCIFACCMEKVAFLPKKSWRLLCWVCVMMHFVPNTSFSNIYTQLWATYYFEIHIRYYIHEHIFKSIMFSGKKVWLFSAATKFTFISLTLCVY